MKKSSPHVSSLPSFIARQAVCGSGDGQGREESAKHYGPHSSVGLDGSANCRFGATLLPRAVPSSYSESIPFLGGFWDSQWSSE